MSVPEFGAIFAATPGINLVLAADAPHFTMLAASDERLVATLTTREETLGRPLFEVFSDGNPENDERSGVSNLRASLETVLRTRQPHHMAVQRYDLRRPDGTWEVRYWAPRNVPVLGPDGAVQYIVHHVEDVTETVQRAEAHQQLEDRTEHAERDRDRLARSEARYRALFDSIDEGFAVIELIVDGEGRATDYRFVEANPAFVQQTGLANAVGRTIRELVPDIEAHWIERYARVAATGEPTRFQSESGAMHRWFDAFAFRLGAPEERRVALLFTDISAQRATDRERERLLRELEVERARLAYVFQRAPSFLAILRGRDYVFELANDAYYHLVGFRDLVGKPVWEALPEVRGQGFEALLDAVVESGEPFIGREVPVHVQRTPGAPAEERFVDLAYMPLIEADGTRAGVIAHGSDVTEQVEARRNVERLLVESERARRDAEAARADAQEANRAKGEFLATMSHELRTPLNAIGGYAELLEMGIRGPVSEEQRVDLGRIQQSQRHLLGLVNEILDLATVDAGGLRVESAAVRAGDTIEAALALVRPQAAAKALALDEAFGANAGLQYLGDEPRVRQVLVNLLGNSIKFTPPGGRVTLGCTLAGALPAGSTLTPGAPYVAIWVGDTGAGVPADQRERIFEPFTQLEGGTNPYTRQTGGTGLGLTISRRLARLMGGDLTVESQVGQGSVFTLWLPTTDHVMPRENVHVAPGTTDATSAVRPELAAPSAELAASLTRIGTALTAEAGLVIRAWVERLRADPLIPTAGRTEMELEDHAATLVADAGLALRTLAESDRGRRGEAGELLRDSRAILAVLGERHGAQRARLGWSETAVAREFTILGEVLREAVRGLIGAAEVAAAERVYALVAQVLTQAERVSLGGFRLSRVVDRKS